MIGTYKKTIDIALTFIFINALQLVLSKTSLGNGGLFELNDAAALVMFISYEIAVLTMAISITSNKFRATAFFMSLFCSTFVFLPAVYQIYQARYPWSVPNDQPAITTTTILMLCLSLSILASLFIKNKKNAKLALTLKPLRINYFQYALITAFLFIIYIIVGPVTFFTHRTENLSFLDSGLSSQLFVISRFGFLGVFIYITLLLHSWQANGKISPRPINIYFFWLILVPTYLAVCANPATGNRFHFLSAITSIALVYGVFSRKIVRYLTIVIATSVAYGAVFEMMRDPLGLTAHELAHKDRILNVDFDVYSTTVNIVEYVHIHGYNWFSSFFSGFTFFLPRSIAAFRDLPLSIYAFDALGFDYSNVSALIMVEFYAALGPLGVIIGIITISKTANRFDYSINIRDKKPLAGALAVVLAAFSPIILRGSFVGAAGMVGTCMLSIVLLHYLGKLKFK